MTYNRRIGSLPVTLEMTVQRQECKDCGAIQQEHIHFAHGKQRYTYRFKRFVLDLCKIGTMADVSKLLRESWETVKDILPDAVQVYDHIHIAKLMNEKQDNVRRDTYNQKSDENKRRLIKGQRWQLLANGDNLSTNAETRLYKALDINRPLATAYNLKESLRRVWWQDNKHDAALVLDDWIEQARDSGLKPLVTVAETFQKPRNGILARYDFQISNGKLEGINNKIKTMKRQAYGYRDMPFFKLKLLSLHDSTYPFSG